MKELFFTLLALSIPLVILAGLLYMFGHGLFTVASDWFERRELEQLRREMLLRRQRKEPEPELPTEPDTDRSVSGDSPPEEAPPAPAKVVDQETTEA